MMHISTMANSDITVIGVINATDEVKKIYIRYKINSTHSDGDNNNSIEKNITVDPITITVEGTTSITVADLVTKVNSIKIIQGSDLIINMENAATTTDTRLGYHAEFTEDDFNTQYAIAVKDYGVDTEPPGKTAAGSISNIPMIEKLGLLNAVSVIPLTVANIMLDQEMYDVQFSFWSETDPKVIIDQSTKSVILKIKKLYDIAGNSITG
ncbi:MAG: hypothetical protein JKY60_04225, partial [Kordiimonadaceae bacterium]|nr:hypothetical protein [Kordiimonadaceae bacterium]